jgi:hypothetical protein
MSVHPANLMTYEPWSASPKADRSHRKSDLGNLCRSNLQKDAQIGLQGRMSEIFPDVSLVTQSQAPHSETHANGMMEVRVYAP